MTKFSDYITGLTADATPDAAADYLVIYDASAAAAKKVLLANLPAGAAGIPEAGWFAAGETWTYVSVDGPTGVFSVPADVTAKYQPGMRVKYTQTTVKYGIITAVGAYSAGVTPITIYGGTDFTLANAAITSPFYSVVKAPLGMNMSPAKWTERVTDTTDANQASPSAGTHYNLGTITISIPIGVWRVSFQATQAADRASAGTVQQKTALSTANNSASDLDLVAWSNFGNETGIINHVSRTKLLTLAAKTSYYLNGYTGAGSINGIHHRGDLATTVIEALSAYL